MRAVVQRVKYAKVKAGNEVTGEINKGLLVLLGVENDDEDIDFEYIFNKIVNLRIFPDMEDKMNLSVIDVKGGILTVSQFTVCGDARKGRRPSYVSADDTEKALKYYEKLVKKIHDAGILSQKGKFGVHMDVHIINDGPVTILLDSRKNF